MLMAPFICPKCQSDHMRRSRTRDYAERVLKTTGRKAYRCQECDWRGFVRRRGDTISYYEQNYRAHQWVRNISTGFLVLIVTLVCYYLMLSLLR